MKKLKRVLEWIATGISVILVSMSLFLLVSPRFGWQTGTVIPGSMEPTLKEGAMIIARPVSLEEIEKGDIITFQPEEDLPLIVHRVVRVIQKDREIYFQTKGDALQELDPWLIGGSNFLGKLFVHSPHLGGLASFVKGKPIYLSLIGILALMLIVVSVRDLRQGILEEKEKRRLKASNNPERGKKGQP